MDGRRARLWVWGLVATVSTGLGCGSAASPDVRSSNGAFVVAGWDSDAPPTLHPRCRELAVASVPDDYAAFEKAIEVWIATCVASRSGAHRERTLVRGNRALRALHRRLAPGQAARIIPRYSWGPFRVEQIVFDSPSASGPTSHNSIDARASSSVAFDAATSGSDGDPGGVDGDDSSGGDDPPGGDLPALDPPDDLVDLSDDVRRLIALLRARGAASDADRLERLLERAAPLLIDIALIAGSYYIATKLRGGVLLFQWGWTAHGYGFQRAVARLDRALPSAERAVGALVTEIQAVESRHAVMGGAGIDWKVLDKIVDGSVPAQLDDLACGPACVKMLLADRGIHVDHARIVEMARTWYSAEIKKRKVAITALRGILEKLDPSSNWVAGPEFTSKDGTLLTARQLAPILNDTGPWIAFVDQHFVVVDGFDASGAVLIRDPWYEATVRRGVRAGSSYRVDRAVFEQQWLTAAIFRLGPR